ncbi:MAG: flagellar basal body rod protein FlgC [Deltaproteobacteria bacterium]|nr:flagellar basal body rod protein FlgC [Deltaproteobacteria bacterium]
MDLFRIFGVSAGGMGAQRVRLSVIAGNLANAETTRSPEGGPYKRRDVIFEAVPFRETISALTAAGSQNLPHGILTVHVAGVRESGRPPRKVYEPQHPDANPDGYVLYPDINSLEEMVDLMSAVRSYEANLAAFNATKTMIRRLLDLGRMG